MGKSGKILEIGAVVDVDRLAEDAVPLSKKILGLSCVLPTRSWVADKQICAGRAMSSVWASLRLTAAGPRQ